MTTERFLRLPVPRQVFADTSGLYALLDRSDASHTAAVRIFRELAQARSRVWITNFIRAEAYTMMRSSLGYGPAIAFLDWLESQAGVEIEPVRPTDELKAMRVLRIYTTNSFSYLDATSFVVMERMHLRHVVTFDSDFRAYGTFIPL